MPSEMKNHKWMVLSNTTLGMLAATINASIVLISLPAICRPAMLRIAKRLEAIQAMEELGSGFYLAMHDLEIRGAGEVLGEGQSGEHDGHRLRLG